MQRYLDLVLKEMTDSKIYENKRQKCTTQIKKRDTRKGKKGKNRGEIQKRNWTDMNVTRQ